MIWFNRRDVGKRLTDIAHLHWFGIEQRLASSLLFQELDDPHQVLAAAVADVVDRVRTRAASRLDATVVDGRTIETCDDAADDVVNVSEVAPHLAAVEERQRLARVERLGEDPHRHVRPAPRTVYGEEAKAGQR